MSPSARDYLPLVASAIALVALPSLMHLIGLGTTSATEVVVFAIACMALNILVGTTGLVSFGHGAWFGIAAYAAGLMQRNWFPGQFVLPVLLAVALVALAIVVGKDDFTRELHGAGLAVVLVQVLVGLQRREILVAAVRTGLLEVPHRPGFTDAAGFDDGVGVHQQFGLVGAAQRLPVLGVGRQGRQQGAEQARSCQQGLDLECHAVSIRPEGLNTVFDVAAAPTFPQA